MARWPLAALILAGFALRVAGLGSQSLWYDEAYSLWASESVGAVFARLEPFHSPVYYLLLAAWQPLAGTSEFAVRFPSVIAGTLWIPAVAWLARWIAGTTATHRNNERVAPASLPVQRGRSVGASEEPASAPRWAGRDAGPTSTAGLAPSGVHAAGADERRAVTGLVVAALVAASPFAVYFSQETRVYVLAALFATISAGVFPRAVASDARRDWADWAAISLIAFFCHYYTGWLLLAEGVWILLARRVSRRFVVATAVISAVILGWAAVTVPGIVGYRLTTSGTPAPAWAVVEVFLRSIALGPRTPVEGTWLQLVAAGIWAVLIVAGLRRDLPSVVTVVALAGTFLLQLRFPWFYPRYLLFLLPFTVLVAWGGARRFGGRGVAIVPAAALGLIAIWAAGTRPDWQRDDYRTVTADILARQGRAEAVVLQTAYQNHAFDRYWRGGPIRYLPESLPMDSDATLRRLAETLNAGSGIWLFQWSSPLSDPDDRIGRWLETNALDAGTRWYGEISLRHFLTPPGDALPPARPVDASLGGLRLVGYDGLDPVPAGGTIRATLTWQAEGATANWVRFAHLVDAGGTRVAQVDAPPLAGLIPTTAWRPGDRVRDEIVLPANVPDGWYWLNVGLADPDEVADGGTPISIGPVAVGDVSTSVVPGIGNAPVALLHAGLDVRQTRADVVLYWQARQPVPDLRVFVHLVDATGRIVTQRDVPAGSAGRDSSRWQRGEEPSSLVRLDLSAVPAGRYRVLAGLYDVSGRLPVGPVDGAAVIGTIDRP